MNISILDLYMSIQPGGRGIGRRLIQRVAKAVVKPLTE